MTPFPPDRTGIADYTAELLEPLKQWYDITLVTSSTSRSLAGVNVVDEAWFRQHGASFDRVLYNFGNSHFHLNMIELLKIRPGVVILHDFGLGDLGASQNGFVYDDRWVRTLYDSHGYGACLELAQSQPLSDLVVRYPSSGFVFDESQGVLVHSRFAHNLVGRFYGLQAFAKTVVIPFPKQLRTLDRETARAKLNLPADKLVVCSFGFINRSKMVHRIITAWSQSGLTAIGHLVLVGRLFADEYGSQIKNYIESNETQGVIFTGYASQDMFDDYLAAADFAIQLRTDTRGESSAAVFDCLSAGVPVIVNAHGSLAEAPDEAVVKLDENFSDDDLCQAMLQLAGNASLRRRIGDLGREIVSSEHNPRSVAALCHGHIERFASATPALHDPDALALERSASRADGLLKAACRVIDRSGPRMGQSCLYVDVTAMAAEDLGTGVQRVVRAQLLQLFANPPSGFRVEPVRIVDEPTGARLFHARTYASRLLGLPLHWLVDQPIEPRAGDIYYMPDLHHGAVIAAARSGLYRRLRETNVRLNFLVYDVLPLTLPHCFPKGTSELHAKWLTSLSKNADQIICISDTVRSEVRSWLASNVPDIVSRTHLTYLHLGADIEAGSIRDAPRAAGTEVPAISFARPTFLMVGTIEPRKGYEQVIPAFAQMWSDGIDINLVIVGAEGWKAVPASQRSTIAAIVHQLRTSSERDKRLFWIESASDAALSTLLQKSSCLLAASWGEGFGLPLIEAARFDLPILARDLPVFREVAGEHAAYFDASTAQALASAVKAWLANWRSGAHPRSAGIPLLTWAAHVEHLKNMLIPEGDDPDRPDPPNSWAI